MAMEKINDRLYSWASILAYNAKAQAIDTSRMDFIHPHVALMPDAHLGKGATVGSVLPTEGAIIPAAVGVDIGCGMIAVRTQYTQADIDMDNLKDLHHSIAAAIPLSAGKYNQTVKGNTNRYISELEGMAGYEQAEEIAPNWRMQLGSLGSGNHFIEVTIDEEERVWLFLHSGSRGVGNKLAMKHI